MRATETVTLSLTVLSLLTLHQETASFQRCSIPTIRNGRVKSRSGGKTITFKCSRRFRLLGEYTDAICFKGEWFPPSIPKCVKGGCPPILFLSNGYIRRTLGDGVFTFFCLPGYALSGSKVLTCDGYRWNGTQPECKVLPEPPSKSCQFEQPRQACGWTHSTRFGKFQWVNEGLPMPSKTPGTGPSIPWRGRFLYLESSRRSVNESAAIFSPVYPPSYSTAACLSLMYNMNGATMGELNVYQIHTRVAEALLASVKGAQGTEWHRLVVPLNRSAVEFQIRIDGVVGPGYLGDIAVDDFQLIQGRDDCQEALTDASKDSQEVTDTAPAPALSPWSCANRCGENTTEALALQRYWSEGYCLCDELTCSDQHTYPHWTDWITSVCCDDYIVEACHTTQRTLWKFEAFFQEIGSSWLLAVCGIALLGVIVIIGIFFVVNRRLRARPLLFRHQREGELENYDEFSDERIMLDASDQMIDFREAFPRDDVSDSVRMEHVPVIQARQISEI